MSQTLDLKEQKKAWRDANREHLRQYAKDRWTKGLVKVKKRTIEQERAYTLRKWGLTAEQYEAMLKAQDGVCAMCKGPDPRGTLAIDHCHETGKIRGLLCHSCNRMLGIYEKNKEVCENYLRGAR